MPSRTAFAEHLGEVPLFGLSTKKELRTLAGKLEEITVEEGEEVVRQGDRADAFFVIIDGTAKVVRNGRKVADLGPSGFFGELALLDPALRTASVVATSRMHLLKLGQGDFGAMLHTSPGFASKLLANLARRIREMDTKNFG